MPIDSKECFTSLTTDGQLYEIYLAAQSSGGGGSGAFGAIYYFNRSNASSISGYYEMSKNLVIGAGTTLTATGAGTHLVGSFATVLNDPNVTTIPSGNWNFENYVSMSSNGGTPKIYGEIYKRNLAGTETLIATSISNPHPITSGTLNELYLWSIPVPATIVLATDRLVVKFYALNLGGRTMTMHFEDANVAQTTTSLPSVDLSAYVLKAGDTMTGKLNLPASTTATAGLNLGNGVIPTTTVAGDVFSSGNNIFFKGTTGGPYIFAYKNDTNTFLVPQIISTVSPTGDSAPALRITQAGGGEALRVEDQTTPDPTAFVVSTTGKVGVGVTPDASVALSVDTTGIKFGDGTTQTTAAVAGVTSVTATSPITSTGGSTPVISTSMATNRLLGRSTAGTGVAEQIAIGTGLSLTAGTLSNTSGTKTISRFTPDNNQPPATNFATLDTRNSIAVLDFDDTTDKNAIFLNVISEAATLGSGLKIRLIWTATTATTGDCVWQTALEKMTTDIDADSFDTAASATATTNATSGVPNYTEITLTTIDSVTAGDGFRIRITRNATSASDTMTGDAELIAVEIRSAA